jgi:hypothetical protein
VCIRLVFGHADEDLLRAQQAVVNAFRRRVEFGLDHLDARRALLEALRPTWGTPPEEWAARAATALVGMVARLQEAAAAAAAAQAEVDHLRRECESLRRRFAEREAEPLRERVRILTVERDRWREEARRMAEQVQALEETLARAQRTHREEVARLREEIAALNRIVVEQQEALNEHEE